MSRIQCELCGGNHLIKKDGVFECPGCGTQYTLEEARKLFAKASQPEPVQEAAPVIEAEIIESDPASVLADEPVTQKVNDSTIPVNDSQKSTDITPEILLQKKQEKAAEELQEEQTAGMPEPAADADEMFDPANEPDPSKLDSAEPLEIPSEFQKNKLPKPDREGFVIDQGTLFAYYGTEKDVWIPDQVTAIGEGCFRSMGIERIHLPKGLKSISDAAFYDTQISIVVIPDSVIHIGKEAFSHCHKLHEVIIGKCVRTIGDAAFSKCTNLTSVTWMVQTSETIPDHVFKIGKNLFSDCISLNPKTIVMPILADRVFRKTGLLDKGYCECCAGKLRKVNPFERDGRLQCTRCKKLW